MVRDKPGRLTRRANKAKLPAASGATGGAASSSSGSKRERPRKPTVMRVALQSAADLAASRSAAEQKAAIAAARRARAEHRAKQLGLTTPVASRQASGSSAVMSSGGSGPVMSSGGSAPLAKRQAPPRASKSTTFEGMDEAEREDEAENRPKQLAEALAASTG